MKNGLLITFAVSGGGNLAGRREKSFGRPTKNFVLAIGRCPLPSSNKNGENVGI